jgi:hypothetical protein
MGMSRINVDIGIDNQLHTSCFEAVVLFLSELNFDLYIGTFSKAKPRFASLMVLNTVEHLAPNLGKRKRLGNM